MSKDIITHTIGIEKLIKIKDMFTDLQKRIDESLFIGISANGLVRVEATGMRVFENIQIDDSLLSNKALLTQHLIEAINIVLKNIDLESHEEMQELSKFLQGDS